MLGKDEVRRILIKFGPRHLTKFSMQDGSAS